MPSPNNPNAPAWIVVRRESTGCCNVLISVGMLKRSSCWVDRFASRNPILCLCETQVPVLKVVQSRKTVVCFGVRDSTSFANRMDLRRFLRCTQPPIKHDCILLHRCFGEYGRFPARSEVVSHADESMRSHYNSIQCRGDVRRGVPESSRRRTARVVCSGRRGSRSVCCRLIPADAAA